MESDVPVVSPNLTLDTLAEQHLMTGETGFYAVMADGKLVGTIDIRQIRSVPRGQWTTTRVGEVMVRGDKIQTITEPQPILDAVNRFEQSGASAIPVVAVDDARRLLGMLTRDGLLRAVQARARLRADATTAVTLLRLEEARERMLAGVEPLGIERVPLVAALGRVLAEPVVALVTLPPWDNSAMDGFAVRAADVAGRIDRAARPPARDRRGRGRARADRTRGARHAPCASSPAAWFRRGPTRSSRWRTPMRRPVSPRDLRSSTSVARPRRARTSVGRKRPPAGTRLLEPGAGLRPAGLAIAAAAGHGDVAAFRRPRVAVLGTGDELVPAGELAGPAQIHDSNSIGLAAQAADAGADVISLGIARDQRESVIDGCVRASPRPTS